MVFSQVNQKIKLDISIHTHARTGARHTHAYTHTHTHSHTHKHTTQTHTHTLHTHTLHTHTLHTHIHTHTHTTHTHTTHTHYTHTHTEVIIFLQLFLRFEQLLPECVQQSNGGEGEEDQEEVVDDEQRTDADPAPTTNTNVAGSAATIEDIEEQLEDIEEQLSRTKLSEADLTELNADAAFPETDAKSVSESKSGYPFSVPGSLRDSFGQYGSYAPGVQGLSSSVLYFVRFVSQCKFIPWEIWVTFPEESQLQKSRATQS